VVEKCFECCRPPFFRFVTPPRREPDILCKRLNDRGENHDNILSQAKQACLGGGSQCDNVSMTSLSMTGRNPLRNIIDSKAGCCSPPRNME
jgi:hypothetical protein